MAFNRRSPSGEAFRLEGPGVRREGPDPVGVWMFQGLQGDLARAIFSPWAS